MEDKFKQLVEIEKEKRIAYDEAFEKYEELKDKYNNKIKEVFNYEDKYLIIDMDEQHCYLRCDECFKTRDLSGEDVILLRGYGFSWIITDYSDATYASWDFFFEHKIRLSDQWNIKDELSKIKETDKADFDSAFYRMINELTEDHKKTMNKKDIWKED